MASLNTYRAVATREGRWWAVDVEGVGHTQGRDLGDARRMAADLVSIMRGVPEESIEINLVTLEQILGGDDEMALRASMQATSVPSHERAPED
jgi:hypothetical protein